MTRHDRISRRWFSNPEGVGVATTREVAFQAPPSRNHSHTMILAYHVCKVLPILSFILFCYFVSYSWSADWYVDRHNVMGNGCANGNPGTQAQPKCNIQEMYTKSPPLQPDDIVYIRGGDYSDEMFGPPRAIVGVAGTAGHRITFQGHPNDPPPVIAGIDLIDGESGGVCQGQKAKHLAFKRLKIVATGRHNGISTLSCLDYSGANYNAGHLFEDVEVTAWGPGDGEGVAVNGNNMIFRRMEVHQSKLVQSPDHRAHGFYITGSNNTFEDSTIYLNPGYGIQVYSSVGCSGANLSNDNIIRNNRLWHNGTDANGQWSNNAGGIVIAPGARNKVYNNLIYDMTVGTGIDIGNHCTDCEVYNNTLYNISGWAMQPGRTDACADLLGTTRIHSNIMANIGGEAILIRGSAAYDIHHNLCHNTGGSGGCNLTGDPAFNNAGGALGADFHILSASAARNRVATSAGACATPTDFVKVTRPQGLGGTPCDLGAYEYVEGGGLPPSGNPIYLSAGGHGDTPTDSGDCTVPENIATPRATLAAAMLCMQVPGKLLYIRGGIYPGKINAYGGAMAGGSAIDNPTRIEGYLDEVVTIQLNEDGTPALFFNGINYVTVAKLTFDAMSRSGTNGLACISSTNLKVLGSTFKNSYFETGYVADCAQVEVTQTTFQGSTIKPVLALEGTITNVTLDQLIVSGSIVQGIAVNIGSGSNSSLSILRTQIRQTGLSGGVPLKAALDLGSGAGAILVNNIIDHNAAGIQIRPGANGAKIYHNAVASNTGVGIQCDSGASSVTISNNISFGNGTDSVVNNCNAMLAGVNLTTDPYWVNATTAPYDFHLQTAHVPPSPALDKLSTVLPEAAMALDCTEACRPVNFLGDLGPYEQGGPGEVIPPTTVLPLLTRYLGMWY